MAVLNREELYSLVGRHNDHCVSIYMPTQRTGAETRHDAIMLKNLLRNAEIRLLMLGMSAAKAREVLKPARQLLKEESFWRGQSEGLAMFLSEGFFRHYTLPFRFPNLALAADRFLLKPLLHYFAGGGQFYLLALSQYRVRIFQGSRFGINEIFLGEMPVSLVEAQSDEEKPKNNWQTQDCLQSANAGPLIFHDQVGEDEIRKYRLKRFLRWIEVSLHDFLRDEHAPLALVGAEDLFRIYRSIDTYPHTLLEGIYVDPEKRSLAELHREAWELVGPYYQRARKDAEDLYWELAATGRTTNSISEAAAAAAHGRIAVLFIRQKVQGAFVADDSFVILPRFTQDRDEALLELTALQTLASGGRVFAVPSDQMPNISPVAAIFH